MFVLERLLSLVAPHECLICQAEGSLLCRTCQLDACPPLPERCYKCFTLSPDSKVCPKCRCKSKLRYVWVRTHYEGAAKDLIHAFKFERAQSAARPLAELTVEALPFLPADFIVSCVPTATSRRRQRGYDHAELLAKEIARLTGRRFLPLLSRHGQTRQVGAKRATRTTQLSQAYWVKSLLLAKGRNILLVDDITTTGATIEAAAEVLKKAGAKSVSAVVFAQKQ